MIAKIKQFFIKQKIAFIHARYHRYMKYADKYRKKHDIVNFKNAIYRAEDAWRKIVILTEKIKKHG